MRLRPQREPSPRCGRLDEPRRGDCLCDDAACLGSRRPEFCAGGDLTARAARLSPSPRILAGSRRVGPIPGGRPSPIRECRPRPVRSLRRWATGRSIGRSSFANTRCFSPAPRPDVSRATTSQSAANRPCDSTQVRSTNLRFPIRRSSSPWHRPVMSAGTGPWRRFATGSASATSTAVGVPRCSTGLTGGLVCLLARSCCWSRPRD